MTKSKSRFAYLSIVILGGLAIETASAQQEKLIIYPKDGQTKEQQEMDEFQCHKWAVEQTGIDPMNPATLQGGPAPAPTQQTQAGQAGQGAVIGGAAKGAIVGTAIGAIAGDTGKGAAIGATVGAFKGIKAKRQAKKAAKAKKKAMEEQQKLAAQQAQSNKFGTYNKAKKVCLEGRGYSVS